MYGQVSIVKICIEDDYGKCYADGDLIDSGTVRFYEESGGVRMKIGNTYQYIDPERKLIKYDNSNYYTHSSVPNQTVRGTTAEQDKEFENLRKLRELQEEVNGYISELDQMQYGNMDPMRYMYIKQALPRTIDQQIRLAQKLGDRELEDEYRQRKRTVERAFQMMDY